MKAPCSPKGLLGTVSAQSEQWHVANKGFMKWMGTVVFTRTFQRTLLLHWRVLVPVWVAAWKESCRVYPCQCFVIVMLRSFTCLFMMWYQALQKWRSLLHHLRAHENCKRWYFYGLCLRTFILCAELICWLAYRAKVWRWAAERAATTPERKEQWKELQCTVWGAPIAVFDSGNTASAVICFIGELWLWSARRNQPLEQIWKCVFCCLTWRG